jgi:nitrile hydratase subunit beta
MIIREMNGVHDMGGMDGFGPIRIEQNEPVFHADWEKRMFALAMTRDFRNVDEFRHAIERIPAPIYLDSSYYERWLNALMTLLVEKKIVTREELMARGADPVAPAQPANHFKGDSPSARRRRPRFREGDRVVARNLNPTGHTRLPRYVRGKRGVIHRDRGTYVFADSNAHHAGDRAQHVYSVTFAARELWGDAAPRRDTLRIDLWEDYLESDSLEAGSTRAKPAKKKSSSIAPSKRGKKR